MDVQTLDMVRLEVAADDIPPSLGLTASTDSINCRRLRVGVSDFLLPVSSEASFADSSGRVSRNRTEFSGCHQFVGESRITFGEGLPVAEATEPPVRRSWASWAASRPVVPGLCLPVRW